MKKWYTGVFLCEAGLLFHIPALIPIDTNDAGNDKKHKPKRVFQFAIAGMRIVLNATAASLFSVYSARDAHDRIIWTAAWIVVGVSLLLHYIAFVHMNFHSKRVSFSRRFFIFSHLSAVNFVFDVQGRGVPTVWLTHPLLMLVNIFLAFFATIVATAVVPIREAWRCYSDEFYPSYEDYDFGTCPAPRQWAPICAYPGIRCSKTEDSYADVIWNTEIHYLLTATVVSYIVYIASIPPKLDYFTVATRPKKD